MPAKPGKPEFGLSNPERILWEISRNGETYQVMAQTAFYAAKICGWKLSECTTIPVEQP